jgi:hypothetical protein
MSENLATEVAAILDAFRADERKAALAEAKKMRITLTHNVTQAGPQLFFETVADQDMEKAELDAFLDGLMLAAKRQEAIAELELHEHHLRIEEKNLRDRIRELDKMRNDMELRNITQRPGRRGNELPPKQQADLTNMGTTIEASKEALATRRRTMAEIREKYGLPEPAKPSEAAAAD